MPFDIPNYADTAHPFLAAPDSLDFEIVTAGSRQTGVLSGCVVTAQGIPDMTVAVASGSVSSLGTAVVVAAVPVLAIGAADPALPRIDVVAVANGTGIPYVQAGVAAAVPLCVPPVSADDPVIAFVYVAALAVSIVTADLADKRVTIVGSSLTKCYVTAMAVALG